MPSPQGSRSGDRGKDRVRESECDAESDEPRTRIFTFVSSLDKCRSRKIARSHVAREVWQQRRNGETRTQGFPGELVWRLKKKTVAKTAYKKRTGNPLTPCPMAVVPGTTLVNPFPNFDLDYGPETQELLHHYSTITSYVMDNEAAKTNFRRVGYLYSKVAPLDPTPQDVVLGFTIENFARCRGQPEPAVAIVHKARAMRLISTRLDDPKRALSDESIGAVACLTSHEALTGDPELFHIHMAGLDQMIRMRGGLLGLSKNPPLQWVVQCLDLSRSFINSSAPKYSRYDEFQLPNEYQQVRKRFGFTESMMTEMHDVYRFSLECIMLVIGMEKLTERTKEAVKDYSFFNNWEHLAKELSSYILSLPSSPGTCNRGPSSKARIRCCHLAALVYAYLALHELSCLPPLRGRFLKRFKSELLDMNEEWGLAIEMLVVVLVRGEASGVTVWTRHRRAWYVANSIMVLEAFSTDTWLLIERRIWKFLWSILAEKTDGGAQIARSIFVEIFDITLDQDGLLDHGQV